MAAGRRRGRSDGSAVLGGVVVGGLVWVTAFLATLLMTVAIFPFIRVNFQFVFFFALWIQLLSNVAGLVLAEGGNLVLFLLYMLPQVVGLVVGGFFVSSNTRGGGGFVAVGYFAANLLAFLAIVALGTQLGTASGGFGTGGGLLVLLVVFLVGGVVQPVVFGGFGGLFGD